MKTRLGFVVLFIALMVPWQDASSTTAAEIMAGVARNAPAGNDAMSNASVKFVITGEGVWHVGIQGGHMSVSQADLPADATISMSGEDFQGFAAGTLNMQQAFMAGRIRVDGDLHTVMKFQSLFSY